MIGVGNESSLEMEEEKLGDEDREEALELESESADEEVSVREELFWVALLLEQ